MSIPFSAAIFHIQLGGENGFRPNQERRLSNCSPPSMALRLRELVFSKHSLYTLATLVVKGWRQKKR